MIEIFNMDCMDLLRSAKDKQWDLAIVDPPYGINAANMQMGSHPNRSRNDGHGSGPGVSTAVKLKGRLNAGAGKLKNRILNKSKIDWDNEIPSKEYFDELFRVSRSQIICGGNYFPLPPTRGIVCWDKRQPWENFSQWEFLWTSFDCPAALFSYSNTGGANAEPKIHPTQKPIDLYRWCLEKFAKPNGYWRILDTHLGSGSIAIACHDYGYDLTATELNKDYFDAASKRLKQHQAQTKLFA